MPFISPKVLCRRHRLTPNRSLGQHFLLHPDQARRLVAALELRGQEVVVEIGAGLGALTYFLAESGGRVIALELDRRLIPILTTEVLPGFSNVMVVSQDALKFDYLALSREEGQSLTVAGNLPYQITSPLLFKLMGVKTAIRIMLFMVQQEVGLRLMAQPGGKDYGILSVLIQYHFHLRRLFLLKPSNFYPAPKVDSVVLGFRPRLPEPSAINEDFLAQVVKAAFSTRRKTLRNTLTAQSSLLRASPAVILAILHDLRIDPGRRAETLSVDDFVRLSNRLAEKTGKPY
ncbi:16S rRNA (adenine(1518)-N(6)/adenine(1519)-N(6))-dimethyltransferase RsmA [Desulfobacca acetoxidans]|uniref:Ribosomal RNA small subunit methyltransferase A n=1 Tax=Desulfobacca acetoxidans (strain ATCC 700848 / DSM 11109 / ASRB2) TaxID=880072 RepID=F2NFR7_DESAR|nr:16S rRNA (adenine(1518)-N(6)/adenine(1519)-N(6))-dimethyltransferase RsmA [Desulfobacca acetoxidans]AEB10186.1 Ribosomal RNA small subunit methyltransferase A [Desulfobacca acetoxidans DSM 11109]HAY22623.1 ribosomal RNA small subunit methyltransferase A [Desulfobacterales bacterium]